MLDELMDYTTTNGSELLRERISSLYKGIDKDQVLVTMGTSEGNFLGGNLVGESGGEAVQIVPTFMQASGIIEAQGMRIRKVHLKEEEKWSLNLDDLNDAVNKKTRVIVLTNPNNPTGQILSKSQIRGVVEIARDAGAWILADEVYRGIEYEGDFTPSFVENYEKAVVTGSLSKVFGLAGSRVGWMVSTPELIAKAYAYKEYTTLSGSPLLEAIGAIALEEGTKERLIARGRKLALDGLHIFSRWVDGHRDIFSCVKPNAGVIALMRHDLPMKSFDICERLFKEKSVGVVPGEVFDLENYLRICFCLEEEKLKEALGLVDGFLEQIVPMVRRQRRKPQRSAS